MRFANKVVLITGAGRGIGRATAERLGERGAALAILDRDHAVASAAADALGAAGAKALALHADITDQAALEGALARALGAFGRIDVLVNNAARARKGNLAQTTPEDWQFELAGTLNGAFLDDAPGAARHGGAGPRRDRQRRLGQRPAGARQSGLQRRQGGAPELHQGARDRVRAQGHPRQHGEPRHGPDREPELAAAPRPRPPGVRSSPAGTRSGGSGGPRTSPRRSPSSPPTRPASSTAPTWCPPPSGVGGGSGCGRRLVLRLKGKWRGERGGGWSFHPDHPDPAARRLPQRAALPGRPEGRSPVLQRAGRGDPRPALRGDRRDAGGGLVDRLHAARRAGPADPPEEPPLMIAITERAPGLPRFWIRA